MGPSFNRVLSLPLPWIDLPDEQDASDAWHLMALMDTALMDATLGLEWFASAQAETHALHAQYTAASAAADPRDWNPRADPAGQALMDPFLQRRVFIHARTFLFALDTVRTAIVSLTKLGGAPDSIRDVMKRWDREMPTVKHVRDSSHHVDERVRGLEHNREIQIAAVDNEFIQGGVPVLVTEGLFGDTFTSTTASGELMGVDVRQETLDTALKIAQAAIDAFPTVTPGQVATSPAS